MSTSNSMMITKQGLMKVSKELIAQRSFNSTLITNIGNVEITNTGVAKGFDVGSYLLHGGLNFSDAISLKIEAGGVFVGNTNEYQVLWSLHGPYVDSIELRVYRDRIALHFLVWEIANIYLDCEYNDDLLVSLEIKNKKINLVVFKNGVPFTASWDQPNTLNIGGYSTLYVGIEGATGTNYWYGSIKLPKLIIYKNESIYYTPSDSNDFHFSKILISDGEYSLTDSSVPIVNHIYKIDIQETIPTHTGVIVKTQIEKDVYLNIKEVGLYEDGGGEEILFATIDKISIDKSSDLYYDLFFYVNILINVVNTVAFPEIIVIEEDHAKHSDLESIEKVLLYVETNLERRIKKNSKTVLRDSIIPWYNPSNSEDRGIYVKELNADVFTSTFGYSVNDDGTLNQGTEEDYYTGNLPNTIQWYGWANRWCDLEHDKELSYVDEEGQQKKIKLDHQIYLLTETQDLSTTTLGVYLHVRTSYDIATRLPVTESSYVIPVPVPNPDYGEEGASYNLPPKEADYFIMEELYIDRNSEFLNATTSQSVGDHLPQKYYQLEDKLAMEQDNCIGVHDYIRFKTDLGIKEEHEFNPSLFTSYLKSYGENTVTVFENGDVSGFSGTNFYFFPSGVNINIYDHFLLEGSFSTGTDINSTQYLFNYGSNTGDASLNIYTENKEAFVSISRLQSLDVNITGQNLNRYYRCKSNDMEIVTYYNSGDPSANPPVDPELTSVLYYAWVNPEWTELFPEEIPQYLYTDTEAPLALEGNINIYKVTRYENTQPEVADETRLYRPYEWNNNFNPSQPESSSNPKYLLTDRYVYFDSTTFSKNSYNKGVLFNKKLCDLIRNKKYYFKLESDSEVFNGFYKYRDKENYTLGFHENFIETTGTRQWIDNITYTGIGALITSVSSDYQTAGYPFTGVLHLIDYNLEINDTISNNDYEYIASFVSTMKKGTEIKSFYHLPFYPYGVYNVVDLSNCDNKLQIVDSSFTGNEDFIDFSSSDSATLCVKMNLENNSKSNYTILSKINNEGNVYFRLYMDENLTLNFVLYTETESVTLHYTFSKFNVYRYTNNDILVTISTKYDLGSTQYNMYINNVLVSTSYLQSLTTSEFVYNEATGLNDIEVVHYAYDYYVARDYFLTNYLSQDEKANSVNYVKDILFFKGTVDQDDLYIINNRLDTNFGEVFNIYISPKNLTDLTISCDNNYIIKTLSDCVEEGNYLLCKLEAPFYNSGDNIRISSTGYGDVGVHLRSLAKVNNFYVNLIPINH